MIIPQELIIAKSKQLHETVDELVTIVADAIQQQTPVHETRPGDVGRATNRQQQDGGLRGDG